MKKTILGLGFILIIFSFLAVPIFSQKVEEADVYYVNVQILKIFTHPKGLYIIYRRAGLKTGEVFIPNEWFLPADGRAKQEGINGQINPYLSFFIKDGAFDHIKVAAPINVSNPIWGVLKNPADYDAKFDGVETLELKF